MRTTIDAARLADEHAALLRIATLVAREVSSDELLQAVACEAGALLGADLAGMIRFDDDHVVPVATWSAHGEHAEVSGRWPLDGDRVATRIRATGAPARDDAWDELDGPIATFVRERLGVRSTVGSPIVVGGSVWGALFLHATTSAHLPADTEERLGHFTDLVATAVANAQARDELRALADEQAALRRVATLIAHQPTPSAALTRIAEEVGTLLRVAGAVILRCEADATVTVVAGWGRPDLPSFVGQRLPVAGDNPVAEMLVTGRPARRNAWADAQGTLAEMSRAVGITCSAAAPIVVERALWGAIVVVTLDPSPLPADTERRMEHFTELVATAIGNVNARAELTASRARIVRSGDAARRRFERDLHDGVQQRLVSLALELRRVERSLGGDPAAARARLTGARSQLESAIDDLRELSHGLHPAILFQGGLAPALRSLGRRAAVPVTLEVDPVLRASEAVEVAAYYVVSEALANAVKHAQPSQVHLRVTVRDGAVHIAVDDDGVGGADEASGTGLVGLRDRVEALGGTIRVSSPPGAGTALAVVLPADGA